MTKEEARKLAELVLEVPEDDECCQKCYVMMTCEPDAEPTAVCHSCAQDIAQELALCVLADEAEIAELRRLCGRACAWLVSACKVHAVPELPGGPHDCIRELKAAATTKRGEKRQ